MKKQENSFGGMEPAMLAGLEKRFFSDGGDFTLRCTIDGKVVYTKMFCSMILECSELFGMMINTEVGGVGRKLEGSIDITQWLKKNSLKKNY